MEVTRRESEDSDELASLIQIPLAPEIL